MSGVAEYDRRARTVTPARFTRTSSLCTLLSRFSGTKASRYWLRSSCATLVKVGASSLDFVLMFWAQQQNHFRLRSEIGVAVNAALREAEIEIPFPQQDIRIRAADPAAIPPAMRQILDPAARPRHHAQVG